MVPKTPDAPSGPTLGVLADSIRRSLLAENKSPQTVMTYLDAVTTSIGNRGCLAPVQPAFRKSAVVSPDLV
jgi:hypothetical protein